MATVINAPTKYYGIYIVKAGDRYWISDDNGGDKYFGATIPTTKDVENYVKIIRRPYDENKR